MGDELTGTMQDDGALVVKSKDGEGKEATTRYVKEADLLAIKGSREELQTRLTAADKDKSEATIAAENKAAEFNTARIKAEADVERLSEDIRKHTGTTEELTRLQGELATAKTAGSNSATELLEARKTIITATYGVAVATVENKSLEELKVFEEALKAVKRIGTGNFAIGGGGGAETLQGKSPHELAQLAYAQSK